MKTVTIKVDGMSCSMCAGAVTKLLNETEGVAKAEVVLEEGIAKVDYYEAETNADKIVASVNESHYTASV